MPVQMPLPPAHTVAGADLATATAARPVARPRAVESPDYLDDDVSERAVVRWLVASAIAVVVALVVGGITRLTESGLSITEWRPLTGVLPPLSSADWEAAYQAYLRIPEAQTVHRGIAPASFRALYWWEWVHRLLARVVGLVIAVPFFVLLLRRRIRPDLQWRLANLPILVAAQGTLGWYMVKSGLTERTDVSPYRLVAHLGVALTIYVIAAWTAMTMGRTPATGDATSERRDGSVGAGMALASLAFLTLLSGGFVAGLDAGHVYNTFPLMGQGLVPREYWELAPGWRNWFENPVAAQFNHRLLALVTLAVALVLWRRMRRARYGQGVRRAWALVAGVAVAQVALGIATLLLAVPLPLAALHQVGAVALLTAGLWAATMADRGAGSQAERDGATRARGQQPG